MTRRDRSLKIQSAFVLLLGMASLAGLGLWLDKELKSKRVRTGEQKPIARLDSGVRTVQRKLDREVLWENVVQSEVLFVRDAIRTAEGSEARIRFDDGTILELAESSLVVLDRSENKIGIEFLKGSVSAKSSGTGGAASEGGTAIEIKTANGKVELGRGGKAGALALTSSKSGELEVTVQEGTAQLVTAQGSAALGANERGEVSASGIQKQKLTVHPKVPLANAKFVAVDAAQLPVSFEWDAAEGSSPAEGLTLQIAQDLAFDRLVYSKPGPSPRAVSLGEGNYYWRVVRMDGKAVVESSEKRGLKVIKHAAAVLESPQSPARLSFFRERPVAKFAWRTLESVGGSSGAIERIELSRDPDFSSLIAPAGVQRQGNRTVATFEGLVLGDYHWRVVSRYEALGPLRESVRELPTDSRLFGLRQLDRLPSPEGLEPAQGSMVGVTAQKPVVRLQWSPVTEAAGYRLRVALDPEFKNKILDQSLSVPQWEGELPATGRLYWAVQSRAAQAPSPEDSPFTASQAIWVSRSGGFKLLSPTAAEVIQFLGEKPEIRFAWEKSGGAERYELQVARDERFQSVVLKQEVEATAESWSTREAPAGDYFWRVRAWDRNERLVALSEIGRYRLREAQRLAAPEKKLPAPQASLLLEETPKVRFEWAPVAGAKGYRIQAWRQNAQGKLEPAWDEETDQTFYEESLEPGAYRWDVRAIDRADRLGVAGLARALALKFADQLIAPVVVKPAAGQAFRSRTPQRIPLQWQKVEGAESYRVTLYRIKPDGSRELVLRKQVEDNSFELPETLQSGQYVWEVAGFGRAAGATGSEPRLGLAAASPFGIQWIGVLQAPSKLKVRVETDGVVIRSPARTPAAKALPPQGTQPLQGAKPKGAPPR